MQKSLYKTADAGDTLSDSGCRSLSIRQRMQETLYQTDAGMQETIYQTADAEVSLSDSGCRRHSITQRMHMSLLQTADAGDTLSDSG